MATMLADDRPGRRTGTAALVGAGWAGYGAPMSSDARTALEALTSALNEHLVAAQNRRGEDDPAVEAAFFAVADAFEAYEDALYAETEEVTPLDLFDDEDGDLSDQD